MGLAVDSQDNVIVTGYSANGPNSTYYTIIYDKDGNEIENATYGNRGDNQALGVAVDSQDNIIVTGYSTNENGNTDYYTIKYETVTAPATALAGGGSGISGGAIAGIVVGASIAGGLVSYLITRRRLAG
jgi:predicted alpha/beta superfamily hydrolase